MKFPVPVAAESVAQSLNYCDIPNNSFACLRTKFVFYVGKSQNTLKADYKDSYGDINLTNNWTKICGHNSGWIVPNDTQLLSIVDGSATNPTIDTSLFINALANNFYWTSVDEGSSPATYVSFITASPANHTEDYRVRLIRKHDLW